MSGSAARPNILFVFADQLRASSLGHAGQEPVLTPNLDALAREGTRFTRAVSNTPLCCPVRASLLTGQYPLAHGVVTNDLQMRPDVPCIAKSLGAHGYHTGYIGKWHLDGPDRGCFTPPGPRRQGFEYWAACNCNHSYFEAFYYRDSPEPIWIDDYEPTAQTDLAIDYLGKMAGREKPFCLFLSWGPPHCPYDQVPDRFRKMYDPAALPVRPNAVNPNRETIANYYAHVTALDWNFGRLMAELDRLGLRENTLVIFTSDHGDMLYSQNRGWKSKPWHESAIIPFIARWPGHVPAGRVERAPFSLTDVMPTLLELAGAPIPPEVEGRALAHLLLGRPGPQPESAFILLTSPAVVQSFDVWRGIITETYTYARFRDRPWVLYVDPADPYQRHNLADEPSVKGLREELDHTLQGWLDRLGDRFETPRQLAARYGYQLDKNDLYPCYYQPDILKEMGRRLPTRKARMARA